MLFFLDTESGAPFIVYILRARLDAETNHAWQMAREVVRKLATLEEFLKFLEKRPSSLDSALLDVHEREREVHATQASNR